MAGTLDIANYEVGTIIRIGNRRYALGDASSQGLPDGSDASVPTYTRFEWENTIHAGFVLYHRSSDDRWFHAKDVPRRSIQEWSLSWAVKPVLVGRNALHAWRG